MTGQEQPTSPTTTLEQRLNVDFALQAAGLGIWEYNPVSNRVLWDERCRALFGLATDSQMSYEQAFEHVHPDDIARVDQAARWVMNPQSDGVFDQTYRTIGVNDGKLRWVRFQGRVDFAPTGAVQRFAGVAQDVTQQVQDRQLVEESWAQLRRIIEATPVAMGLHVGPELRIELANDTQLSYWGKDRSALGKPFREVLPELEGQGFFELFEQAYATGQPYQGQAAPAHLSLNGTLGTYYFDYSFNPIRNEQGQVYAVLNTAINVTEQVLARQQLEESELFARTLFEQSPVAKAVFVDQAMLIRTANKNMLSMWGKEPSVIGRPFMEAVPELTATPQADRLRQVLATGERFYQAEEKFELLRYGQPYTGYYEYSYEALRSATGAIYGVMCVASEVTQQVLARQKLAQSEARFRSLIEQAPVAIGLFVGPDMRIEVANQQLIKIWGKGASALGQPLVQALPELIGQPFLALLEQVYTTGVPFSGQGVRADLVVGGQLQTYYYDFTYQPILDQDGLVYAIMDVAIDVTAQTVLRQQYEQTQQAVQRAVELAELATWHVHLPSGQVTYSERYNEWMGLGQQTSIQHAFDAVVPAESVRLAQAYQAAISPGSSGRLEAEFTIANRHTATPRLVHIVGQTYLDEQGQPMSISGFAQDLTQLRASQQALELLVSARTKELAASIDQLEESNSLLVRSNENLQTFAYVASHDLQEPLRKIQQFGDLLKTRFADSVGSEELVYIERMQLAASRMSTLIKDLLNFSRISTQRNTDDSVPLRTVIDSVLGVLELTISDTSAQVIIDPLPTVLGDATQLSQLFQNLLSNALKFRRPDTRPIIRVSSQLVTADQLPATVRPARRTDTYQLITVADNGIGFDEKYLDRIFQVFQRLHGKSQYVGTGIGLAICEKVVTNHGGMITARSEFGQGATFLIYLPAETYTLR